MPFCSIGNGNNHYPPANAARPARPTQLDLRCSTLLSSAQHQQASSTPAPAQRSSSQLGSSQVRLNLQLRSSLSNHHSLSIQRGCLGAQCHVVPCHATYRLITIKPARAARQTPVASTKNVATSRIRPTCHILSYLEYHVQGFGRSQSASARRAGWQVPCPAGRQGGRGATSAARQRGMAVTYQRPSYSTEN